MSEDKNRKKLLKRTGVAVLKLVGSESLNYLLTIGYLFLINHFMGWSITLSQMIGIWIIISMAEKEILFLADAIKKK